MNTIDTLIDPVWDELLDAPGDPCAVCGAAVDTGRIEIEWALGIPSTCHRCGVVLAG